MTINWEKMKTSFGYGVDMFRSKVPGGWLILYSGGMASSMTFFPDPNHQWDGNSIK